MKAKLSSISAIICLITLVFFCILACDNGSVSDSSASNSSGLVDVSLTVDKSSASQKSISVDSDYDPANLKFFYKATPQWSQNRPIHGSTNDQFILIPNCSAGSPASLGSFTAGEWLFEVQVKYGSNLIYQGTSTTSIYSGHTSVNVEVAKIIQLASGTVSVTVTAPTVDDEAMTVAWSGTASGSSGTVTGTPLGNGTTEFTYTASSLSSGYYTFTLNHSSTGAGAAIGVDLRAGERAEITGHLDNGIWQVGYITVKVHNVEIHSSGCSVQANINSAAAGEKVSFYVSPSPDELTVICGVSNVPTTYENGLYTFVMPDGDVVLTATCSGVDPDISIAYFKAFFKILYDSHPGVVTFFGPSASGPAGGTEYYNVKNVKIWYEDHKILWHTDDHKVKFKSGSMINFFKDCSTLQTINLTGFITSAVTNMAGMFQNCTSLTSVTFDNEKTNGKFVKFDTGAVQDMSQMFDNCVLLPSVSLAGFDTHSVVNMSKMFFACYELTEIELDSVTVTDEEDPRYKMFVNFNTANVTDMSCMFAGWDAEVLHPMKLESVDVSGLDTKNVKYMQYMFYQCKEIDELDVSNWNTSSVQNMSYMFAGLNEGYGTSLNNLHLTKWDFSSVTTTNRMFDRAQSLSDLTFPETTNFESLTTMTYMFSHCTALTPEVFRDIVSTWKFASNPLYIEDDPNCGIYGRTTSSFFGSHDDTNTGNAGRNYIFRNTMTKKNNQHPEYGKFDNRKPKDAEHNFINYVTKDDVQLWIGGNSTDNKYAKLTVFENVNQ